MHIMTMTSAWRSAYWADSRRWVGACKGLKTNFGFFCPQAIEFWAGWVLPAFSAEVPAHRAQGAQGAHRDQGFDVGTQLTSFCADTSQHKGLVSGRATASANKMC
jgi:hypothetical protein